jgi:hypothetical protein
MEMNDSFEKFALSKFSGCDFNDEVLERGAIWLMGVEHGWPRELTCARRSGENDVAEESERDDAYSLEEQRSYPFNRKAFKLLAAMHGYGTDWLGFAEAFSPFVKGSRGFFKGNLYPYPCNNLGEWPEWAVRETGFLSKADYAAWCHQHRFPVIQEWVNEYQPRLIVASGFSCKEHFAGAMMSHAMLQRHEFDVPGRGAGHFFHARNERGLLVVTPHLSGSRLWSSDASVHAAGCAIAALYEEHFGERLAG